jgi:hypothetical protein
MMKIHPHVEKFVDAQTRNVIRFEAVSSQVFFLDIEVAFKWRYAPAEWSVGYYRTAAAKFYAYVFQLSDSRFSHAEYRPATATTYYIRRDDGFRAEVEKLFPL